MPRIRVLDRRTAMLIAAGEVVERPASVVRELVDNSIDAGATRIRVEIQDGGKKLIRVKDNGIGMSHEDALLAFRSHATSKISSADDLLRITTLGFRGEALPSIARVSKVTLLTRERDALEGTKVVVEGGRVVEHSPAGCPPGTSVQVERLFYNTPARRKFLKGRAAETSAVASLLTKYLLAFPEIHFEFVKDGRSTVFPASGQRSRIARLYGAGVAEKLREFSFEHGSCRVHGFVSPPELARATRAEQYLFVNRRYVRTRLLPAAIDEASHGMVQGGRHLMVFAFLELPPEQVDVNVHPAKVEVRFRDEEALREVLTRALREALRGGEVSEPRQLSLPASPVHRSSAPPGEVRESRAEYAPSHAEPLQELRPLAQLHATYILAESPSGLVLVDQHAAHERVLFERFLRQLEEGRVKRQRLVSPALLELSPREAALLEENLEHIEELGLEIERFGERTYLVKGVPAALVEQGREEVAQVVRSLIDACAIREEKRRREEMVYRIACRRAVKAGEHLTPEEMQALLRQLRSCRHPETCPHGRPTMLRLELREIERRFGR